MIEEKLELAWGFWLADPEYIEYLRRQLCPDEPPEQIELFELED